MLPTPSPRTWPHPLLSLTRSDTGRLVLELTAALVLIVEVVVLIGFSTTLNGVWQTVFWFQWFLVLLGLRAWGFFRVLGPVFAYDLVRSSRRRRHALFRILYCVLLFGLLLWVAHASSLGRREDLQPNELAGIALQFFTTFMATQFAVLVVATPAYVAGAIAEEKERQTLPFLLATDLNDREIVLGKMASRLVHVAMYLLAGLPILSALQVLGGVDPELVLAGYAATAATVLSLGALSIFNSVALRKPRDAMIATYTAAGGYLLLSSILLGMVQNPSVRQFPSTDVWTSPVTAGNVIQWFAAGNVFVSMEQMWRTSGGAPTSVVPGLLRDYVLFHVVMTVLFAGTAVLRLWRVEQTEKVVRRKHHQLWTRLFGRPAVTDEPMIWKEIFVEQGFRLPLLGRLLVLGLAVLSFVPVYQILTTSNSDVEMGMNIWVRGVGTAVGCLLIVSAAVRAAGCITAERERQTLDSLLTTPLEANDLLFGKWLGCILGQRWGWFWLGSIYLLGVITGGVSIMAIPFVLATWLILAGFFSMLGLWFGVTSRSTAVATLGTVLTTVVLGGGHWFITGMCCVVPLFVGRAGEGGIFVMLFLVFGLTPPATLALMAFRLHDFEATRPWDGYVVATMVFTAVGLGIWIMATVVLWNIIGERFRRQYQPDPQLPTTRSPNPGAMNFTSQ